MLIMKGLEVMSLNSCFCVLLPSAMSEWTMEVPANMGPSTSRTVQNRHLSL